MRKLINLNKYKLIAVSLMAALALTACGNSNDETETTKRNETITTTSEKETTTEEETTVETETTNVSEPTTESEDNANDKSTKETKNNSVNKQSSGTVNSGSQNNSSNQSNNQSSTKSTSNKQNSNNTQSSNNTQNSNNNKTQTVDIMSEKDLWLDDAVIFEDGSNAHKKYSANFKPYDNPYFTLPLPALPKQGGWADFNSDFVIQSLLDGYQLWREKNGYEPAVLDKKCCELAQYQARYCAKRNKLLHTDNLYEYESNVPSTFGYLMESAFQTVSSPYFYKYCTRWVNETGNNQTGSDYCKYVSRYNYTLYYPSTGATYEEIISEKSQQIFAYELMIAGFNQANHSTQLRDCKKVGFGVAMSYDGDLFIICNGDEESFPDSDVILNETTKPEVMEEYRTVYSKLGCR